MPVIPQITNPFQGKGYQSSLNNQNRPGGEQFDIIQLTKPHGVSESTERQSGKPAQQQLIPNRTDLPQLMVKTPKDPTMAVETLKQLISSELLATAEANGYTELHGELEGLSKSIYLQVNELVSEMLNQEQQTTMFSGDRLFDLLRNLVGAGNELSGSGEKLTAVANFLKAVNFAFNRDEILNALSANLRFLSTYFSPSPILSEKLGKLADAWAGIQARENFELLKGETVKLLHNVSESLLNNEKTQILIPLIIHNLSRYNTNDYMLKDTFSHMLTHVPHSQKGAFIAAFDDFLNAVLYGKSANADATETSPKTSGEISQNPQAAQNPENPQTAQNSQTAQGSETPQAAQSSENPQAPQTAQTAETSETSENNPYNPQSEKAEFPRLYAEKLESGQPFPPEGMNRDTLADGLRGFLLGKFTGIESINITLSGLVKGMSDVNLYSSLQTDLANIDSITSLINYLNDILMQLPDVPERQILFEMLSETVTGMAEKGELPPESPMQAQQTQQAQSQSQPQQAQSQNQAQQAQYQPQTQSQPLPEQAQTQPQSSPEQSQQAQQQPLPEQNQFQPTEFPLPEQPQQQDLPKQIQLSDVQPPPPDEQGSPTEIHSSLEELTSFIEKNINHSALKTLDSYNASNLLQSLINAPGVYTPLSHFIIPLQIGDTKAFGELWVDNEDRSGGGSGGGRDSDRTYHLFLTFEIEAVGRFETDLYAVGSEVNLAVLHPEGFSGEMKSLKEKINRIIASTSYSVKEFQTGVLREPHDLTEIFPRIVEKRQGLDIVI